MACVVRSDELTLKAQNMGEDASRGAELVPKALGPFRLKPGGVTFQIILKSGVVDNPISNTEASPIVSSVNCEQIRAKYARDLPYLFDVATQPRDIVVGYIRRDIEVDFVDNHRSTVRGY